MKKLKRMHFRLSDKWAFILVSLLYLALAAIFLTWFLEYRYFINDVSRAWSFVFERPKVFWYNCFVCWLGLIFLWGICRRPIVASGIAWIATIVISYIHINKFRSRGNPLLPEDFQLASQVSSLTKFVDVWSIAKMVFAILCVIMITIILQKKVAQKLRLHYLGNEKEVYKSHLLIPRIIIIAISIVALAASTDFVRHNNDSRYYYVDFLDTTLTAWNQVRNYDENGFILGFLYNLQKLELSAPDLYSAEYIDEIHSIYSQIAEEENLKRSEVDDANIVIILSESTFDPSVSFNGKSFEDYYPHTGGDVMPFTHELMKKYPSGYMYTLDYGGGTANIEFETLTSMTNYWINAVPYTSLLPKAGNVPSVASMLKEQGYKTTAIHPYNGGMYKRNIALVNEGFDTFITESEMDFTEHNGDSEYINDQSAFKQILKTINDSDEKQMIVTITMQSHTPYNASTYEKHNFEVLNENIDDYRKSEISTYYQSLYSADQYLREFIGELEKSDEETIVLFYGDHSAGLFEETNSNEDKSVRDLSRVTPYFIYNNFGKKTETKNLPTTSPNCLVNTMFDVMNWKKSDWYYLVDEVCAIEPILAQTWLDGRELADMDAIQHYNLYTYDLLGGKKYWLK